MRTPVHALLALIGFAFAAASCGGETATPAATDPGTAGTEAATGTEATSAMAASTEIPACPVEQSLADYAPCDCFGTVVTDVKTQYADCVAPLAVICCPGRQEPVCE